MRIPILSDDAFLKDVDAVPADTHALHFWWLGQSGFLLHWKGQFVLLDPYLSESLSMKYQGTDKPHVRMTQRVVDPARLRRIAVATSSHNHTDHLDRETLDPLMKTNPGMRLLIPEANRAFVAERLGTDPAAPIGLTAGQSVEIAGFRFHGIPAAHNTLETDAQGRNKFMGYIVELGPWKVYHSGDTLLYVGMEDWLRKWSVDVAFLPINGDRPERRVAGNLNGAQAAQLAHDIGARCVVPCHYDMFEFNTASPAEFETECRRLGQPFQVLLNGEHASLPPR